MSVPLRIDYGPYDAFGVITHRIQKVRGLIKYLKDLGYVLEIREVGLLNRLEIVMCDRKIFQCDIRHLKFNMDYDDDVVCRNAVEVVEEAGSRMTTQIHVSNYVTAKKGNISIEIKSVEEENMPQGTEVDEEMEGKEDETEENEEEIAGKDQSDEDKEATIEEKEEIREEKDVNVQETEGQEQVKVEEMVGQEQVREKEKLKVEDDEEDDDIGNKFRETIKQETHREMEQLREKQLQKTLKEGMEAVEKIA